MEKMRRIVKIVDRVNPTIFFLGIHFLMFLIFYVKIGIPYEVNDDISMMSLSMGVYGEYEPHLFYINIIIGRLLAFLFELFPVINWYTLLLGLVNLLSFSAIIVILGSFFDGLLSSIPSMTCVLALACSYYEYLQYSRTSGIAIATGILFFLYWIYDGCDDNLLFLASLFFSAVGSMYRFPMVFLIGIAFVPALFYMILLKRNNLVKIIIGGFFIIIVCILLEKYNTFCYESDMEWARYKEFNDLRPELTDYSWPDYAENKEVYNSLNISENTLYNFNDLWDFYDPDVFTIEMIEALADAKPYHELDTLAAIRTNGIGRFIDVFTIVIPRYFGEYGFAYLLLSVTLICIYCGFRAFIPFLFTWIMFLTEQFILLCRGKYMIRRVDMPCFLGFVVVSLFLIRMSKGRENSDGRESLLTRNTSRIISLCFALASIVVSLYVGFSYLHDINHHDDKQYSDEEYDNIKEIYSDTDNVYICSCYAEPSIIQEPWRCYPKGSATNVISLGGWEATSPQRSRQLARYGIENPYRDIIDKENAYLMLDDKVEIKENYIREHYSDKVRCEYVRDAGDMKIYQVLTK